MQYAITILCVKINHSTAINGESKKIYNNIHRYYTIELTVSIVVKRTDVIM